MVASSSDPAGKLSASLNELRSCWCGSCSPSKSTSSELLYASASDSSPVGESHSSLTSSVKRLRMVKSELRVPPEETSVRRSKPLRGASSSSSESLSSAGPPPERLNVDVDGTFWPCAWGACRPGGDGAKTWTCLFEISLGEEGAFSATLGFGGRWEDVRETRW